jgi:hypothetical protein
MVQTGNTLTITKNGVYQVAVKQNQGCIIEKTAEITVNYPSGFDLSIKKYHCLYPMSKYVSQSFTG